MADVNTAEARTETGEIKDQTPTTETKTESKTEPQLQDDSVLGEEEGDEDESVLGTETKDGEKPTAEAKETGKTEGAPDKYSDFTFPEGYEANQEELTEASTLFKELNLDQAGAQKLIDLYTKVSLQAANAPVQFWQDQQKAWKQEIAADPGLGPRIKEVKANFSKMLASLNQVEGITPQAMAKNNELIASFRSALALTGIGNNPAFVRMMDRLAANFVEGAHVAGNGPSIEGQTAPGKSTRPSPAQAMYPNLA